MKNKLLLTVAVAFITVISSFGQEIKWYSIEEALELNKKEPKKFIIDVYTDWCHWCKVMDKQTFKNKEIAKLINKHFYAVKFNAEQRDSVTFQGQRYGYVPSGRRGVHEFAYALLGGQMSYPTIVFMNGDLQLISRNPGFHKPKDLEPILKIIGEDIYKDKAKMEEFKKNFKSNL
jgi:thioredoxin-related protein